MKKELFKKLGEIKIKMEDVELDLYDDSEIAVCFDVKAISDDLQSQIDAMIRKEYGEKMEGKPVVVEFIDFLARMDSDKRMETTLIYAFNDGNKKNEMVLDIPLDMTEYKNEIKQMVVKEVVNRFF